MSRDDQDQTNLAILLAAMRRRIAYKGFMYADFAKDAKGMDAHIWQAKSAAMFDAHKETDELWGLFEPYYANRKPVLKLVKSQGLAKENPERNAEEGKKSGSKVQLKVVSKLETKQNKESKQ